MFARHLLYLRHSISALPFFRDVLRAKVRHDGPAACRTTANCRTLSFLVLLVCAAVLVSGTFGAKGLDAQTQPTSITVSPLTPTLNLSQTQDWSIGRGASLAAGSASFDRSANGVVVRQSSRCIVIDWPSFDIAAGTKMEFLQPDANAIAVIRMVHTSSGPTQILGSLTSNGRLLILDPNGIVFGPTAMVNVGGIIASTGRIETSQIASGLNRVEITDASTGAVENAGTITVKSGGLAAFVAPQVVNRGVIHTDGGQMYLAAASNATLDLNRGSLIPLTVSHTREKERVQNSGILTADGGRIALTAGIAAGSVIDLAGVARAQSVGQQRGEVIVDGGTTGSVRVTGDVDVSGASDSGGRGGYASVSGHDVYLDGASIDVSGAFGGGEAHIGDSGRRSFNDGQLVASLFTYFSADSVVRADALTSGDGGAVVVSRAVPLFI